MNRSLFLMQALYRFLKRGLLIGILFSSAAVFLATQMGLNTVVWFVKKIVPGELKILGLQGKLIGPMKCDSLFYQGSTFSLSVSELSLNWKVWNLIRRGQFLIHSLIANSVSLIYSTHSNQTTDFQLPSLLKRIRITSFTIHQFSAQAESLHFQCQGTVDREWQLNWQLSLNTEKLSSKCQGLMELAGTLTGMWDRYPQLQLIGRSQPFAWNYTDKADSIQFTMPSLEWHAAWQPTGFKTTLALKQEDYGFLNAFITLPDYQGNTLPKLKQIVQSEIQVNISNWDKLHAIFSQFLSPAFSDISGILEGSLKFQSSFESLKKGWKEPGIFLMPDQIQHPIWRKFFVEAPSIQLDLLWKQPSIPKLGLRFDTCHINTMLDYNQILWRANLTAIENNKPDSEQALIPAQWNLSGKTQLGISSRYNILAQPKAKLRFSTQLTLNGDPLPLFNATPYQLVAKPSLHLTADSDRIVIDGSIHIPSGQIHSGESEEGSKSMFLDDDIVFMESSSSNRLEKPYRYFIPLDTQLTLTFGKDVQLYYDGLVAYLDGVLKLKGNLHQPLKAWGELPLRSGHYNYYGQILTLNKDSRLIFTEFFDNPKLDISASKLVWVAPMHEADSDLSSPMWHLNSSTSESKFASKPIKAKVGFRAQGPADSPYIYLYSEPAGLITNQVDLLSYLLTGQSSQSLNAVNTQLLLDAAYQLTSHGKENSNLIVELQKKIGLDYLNIQSDPILDPNTYQLIQNTAVVLGKRITPKLYVSYSIGLVNSIRTLKANYFLNRYLSLEGSMSRLSNSVDLLLQTEH